MCGRYTLTSPVEVLAQRFLFDPGQLAALPPRYNVAPSQEVLAVVAEAGGARAARLLRWGLRTRDPARAPINLRAETVGRHLTRLRRCLVPADGFYEWRQLGGQKLPWRFTLRDGAPFAFAGLWDEDTCCILTTAPNELVAPVHDRMPVILRPEHEPAWLAPEPGDVRALLLPYPAAAMRAYPVSRRVNNPRHDDPECIRPLA